MTTTRLLRASTLVAAFVSTWTISTAGQAIRKPDRVECAIEGQTYFPFGYYDPFLPNDMDVQTQISYRCYGDDERVVTSRRPRRPSSRKDKIVVQISMSRGSAGTFDRRMSGVSDDVRYNVYLDPARTVIWGDGTGGTSTYSKKVELNGEAFETVLVFGRMPANQNPTGGAYADILAITLDF